MSQQSPLRIAIVYPGNAEIRATATPENNRFAPLFQAFAAVGVRAEAAVYHDDFYAEVREQLLGVDGVLVWVNPIEGGRDRTLLDRLLREIAAAGIFVSTHPDMILKLGTKEILYQTRQMSWGSDIQIYRTMDELRQQLPPALLRGEVRVLKQYRGHSGIGVWKVESLDDVELPGQATRRVQVRHAQRGSNAEEIALEEFFQRCEPYFANGGRIIDQLYQARLHEGMFRCYLVHDQVAGFGFQAVNALYPAPPGMAASEAPQPGPRLYYPATMPEGQLLKQRMESEWLPQLQELLEIERVQLPVLWDADFFLGPKQESGEDGYVLCEINVSSVAPFPDSAIPLIVEATQQRVAEFKSTR